MRQAATLQTSECILNNLTKSTVLSEQTQTANQLNQTVDTGIQSRELKLTQQTGRTDLLESKEKIYQTIVFLPGLDFHSAFPNSTELTQSATGERVITDTGQSHWLTDTSDETIAFLDDLLAPIALPTQSSCQGELNTPTIDKQEEFKYNGYQAPSDVVNKFPEIYLQSNSLHQLTPAEDTESTTININQANAEVSRFYTIRDLIQDDQMFRADCDPALFESMHIEDNLNNNLGLEAVTDLASNICPGWLPEPADFRYFSELPESLFEEDTNMEKEQEASPPSPIPAPSSPTMVEAIEIKSENKKFDLISFIFNGENDELLTPCEEIECPVFVLPQVQDVYIKCEPEPSTSAAPSPRPSTSEETENVRPKRRATKRRRFSSDSDYSIGTSASSFNATAKKTKKRGRPAKELITNLPTIEDFGDIPREHASHLVLRIKNNEASRKSRMKSKSKQTEMDDECDRLSRRQQNLRTKKNKLDTQIEILKRWLLGQN